MKICVFCASSDNIPEKFTQNAYLLGKMIAENGDELVYGGAIGGSMSAVAQGVKDAGGKITGVIAQVIIDMGRMSELPDTMIQVDSLSDRKIKMRQIADVFVVLPGGYGTLDELFDVATSAYVGEHNKPIICLNQAHFYDPLIAQLTDAKYAHFVVRNDESFAPYFVSDNETCIEMIQKIKKYNR